MKVKLIIEYDGAGFSGWQRQPGQRTVQQELDAGLQTYLKQEVVTTASGRTDKGVHARAQAVSFELEGVAELDTRKLTSALNGICAEDLRIRSAEIAPSEFNARFSPHIKCYTYSLNISGQLSPLIHQQSLSVNPNLDIPSMIRAAKLFEGEKDFSSFRCRDCNAKTTVRTILRSEISRINDDVLEYRAHGKGFLMHMVRIIAGTLLDVGKGKLSAEEIPEIIAAKDRCKAGSTLAAKGLRLEWVRYL